MSPRLLSAIAPFQGSPHFFGERHELLVDRTRSFPLAQGSRHLRQLAESRHPAEDVSGVVYAA
jgi:hypothetical protein